MLTGEKDKEGLGQRYALVNCDVFTGAEVEYNKAVVVSSDRIESVLPLTQLEDGIPQRDLKGLSVAPGFIDVQVNGGGGIFFNDAPCVESISKIAEAHRRFGTTNLLPTYITGPNEGMQQAVEAVQHCISTDEVRGVLGIHFEGPFISEPKAGVHNKEFIRTPNKADLATITSLTSGVTLLTVAPEIVGPETIQELCAEGILVSVGHTDATSDVTAAAFDAGARCTTHLYNAMSALTSRAPGVVGAALDDRESWAGIIVDGFHADFVAVRVAMRAKGKGKMFLVTDAMPPVGSDNDRFTLGPYDIQVDQGRCVTPDGILAGSALDMATAVRNCVQKAGIPKDEALRMASTYAADFLGLDQELGRILPGYRANLTIFNNQINVTAVVIDGEFIGFD